MTASDRLRTVVHELEAERTRAVGDLRRAVLNLGRECLPEQRAELARVLYWRHSEVPISDITVASGYDQSALRGRRHRPDGWSGDDCYHDGV